MIDSRHGPAPDHWPDHAPGGSDGGLVASVRLHLAIQEPDLDVDAIRFIHLPSSRFCLTCSGTFSATDPYASCPACGGAGMPTKEAEVVELEWDDPAPVGMSDRGD